MKFAKVHGLGNDFMLIDARDYPNTDWVSLAQKYCQRRVGVGADGILLVDDSAVADIKMRIFNADGSEAEMCGNGIRCFAYWVYSKGIVKSTHISVETLAGIIRPQVILDENGAVSGICVDMGEPILDCASIPVLGEGRCIDRHTVAGGRDYQFTSVLMGVPHTYIYVDSLNAVDINHEGAAMECAPIFPKRTNVNFVQVLSEDCIEMRTFERGCGATLACGTGASGACVAGVISGRTNKNLTVRLQKGELKIRWADNNRVYMTGPAQVVYEAEL